MQALVFRGVESVVFETVPAPRIEHPADAVIAVSAAGVCGSDLHVYHGRETGLDVGTVLGHEFVGTVLEAGAAVEDFAVGDCVVAPFTTNCGQCFYCARGLTCRCENGALFGWTENGAGLHGGQAERVRVPLADATLVAVPEGVADEEALLAGDVLSTGFHAAAQADLAGGEVVAVVGCGPVGLMAVVGALEHRAAVVFALDRVPERLELAAAFGATPVDVRVGAPGQAVRNATAGRGADAVLECVGGPLALRLAVDLVRPGGTLSSVGVHTADTFAFTPMEAYARNLTFRAGRCPARALLPRMLELAASGRHDLTRLISHRLPLSAGPEAYDLFARQTDGCTKVVLAPGD